MDMTGNTRLPNFSTPHTTTTTATNSPLRAGTPDHSPFQDEISSVHRTNPFNSPFQSRPGSLRPSSSAVDLNQQALAQRYFHSRRVKKGEVERPWMNRKDPREKWVTIIPLVGIAIGFLLAGFLVYDGMKTVVSHTYCPVLDEDFSGGFNTKVWTKEAEVGGFGYGFLSQSLAPKDRVLIVP